MNSKVFKKILKEAVLIPFIAGMFLNGVIMRKIEKAMGLNPFYCRDVFECGQKGQLHPETKVLIPFIAGMFLNATATVAYAGYKSLNPFYCRDVFE